MSVQNQAAGTPIAIWTDEGVAWTTFEAFVSCLSTEASRPEEVEAVLLHLVREQRIWFTDAHGAAGASSEPRVARLGGRRPDTCGRSAPD